VLALFSMECLNAALDDLAKVIQRGLGEVNRYSGCDPVLL
jgi:hypothetical protein